jgi:hypothetical protein
LYNYNARLYDAETGRFLQTDPKHKEMVGWSNFDRYSYVHGNPINMIDPSGEIGIFAAIAGGIKAAEAGAANIVSAANAGARNTAAAANAGVTKLADPRNYTVKSATGGALWAWKGIAGSVGYEYPPDTTGGCAYR